MDVNGEIGGDMRLRKEKWGDYLTTERRDPPFLNSLVMRAKEIAERATRAGHGPPFIAMNIPDRLSCNL